MNAPVSSLPKGMNAVRLAIAFARARGADWHVALKHAESAWGRRSTAASILRSAVDAGATDGWGSGLAAQRAAETEFVEALRPATIIGRMTGMRRVPLKTKFPRVTSGVSVGWAGESQPIKVSSLALDAIEIDQHKIAGIAVTSQELVRASTPAADGLIRADLLASVAAFTDQALLDPDAAGVEGGSPASITNGAPSFASSGSSVAQITADLEKLFEVLVDFGINMVSPYFITTSRIAFKLAMKRNTDGSFAFPNMGVRGGDIGGVPVLVAGNALENDDSPAAGSIILVDAAEILFADTDEISITLSEQSAIELDDAPDDPTTASSVVTSFWQMNLVGWRVARPISWEMRRPGAVAVLTGVSY
jgi:HK97 family phage major capsid protein